MLEVMHCLVLCIYIVSDNIEMFNMYREIVAIALNFTMAL